MKPNIDQLAQAVRIALADCQTSGQLELVREAVGASATRRAEEARDAIFGYVEDERLPEDVRSYAEQVLTSLPNF